MSFSIDRLATLPEAAEYMKINVEVLKKLNADGTGPEFIMEKGKPRYDWNDLDEFMETRTICVDGSVIDKVKSKILGYADHYGIPVPIVAAYCTQEGPGERTLSLVDPVGRRPCHGGGYKFGDGDGYRANGYILREVADPELAGFSDEKYLGMNAVVPRYKVLRSR